MPRPQKIPVALTIAGSDSGGGAGVQMDLKTFAAAGVHGVCALTALTAQNPRRVLRIEGASPLIVWQQLEAIFSELPPKAAKTGMLYSSGIIHEVARFLANVNLPLVVDPVMVSTSGVRLLQKSAERALRDELFPLARLLTPNIEETRLLTGISIRDPEDMRAAARQMVSSYGVPVLIKGGHLEGAADAVDLLFDGRKEWLVHAPRIPTIETHGTGCTYSAAITAGLATGRSLSDAVLEAKDMITLAIRHSFAVGNHTVLNPFAARKSRPARPRA